LDLEALGLSLYSQLVNPAPALPKKKQKYSGELDHENLPLTANLASRGLPMPSIAQPRGGALPAL